MNQNTTAADKFAVHINMIIDDDHTVVKLRVQCGVMCGVNAVKKQNKFSYCSHMIPADDCGNVDTTTSFLVEC